jgi:hypothetical protein
VEIVPDGDDWAVGDFPKVAENGESEQNGGDGGFNESSSKVEDGSSGKRRKRGGRGKRKY